jgi:hypothetical protein
MVDRVGLSVWFIGSPELRQSKFLQAEADTKLSQSWIRPIETRIDFPAPRVFHTHQNARDDS